MINRRNFAAVCAALACVLGSPALFAADKPPIKIGVSVPLSGFQTPNGTMYRIGITMAVEDVNKAGGVNGSPVQLVIDDDQSLADQAVLLFRRHVADGVVAEFVKKFPKVKKIAIGGDLKEASGASGIKEFQKAAAAHGLQILDTVGFDTRTTDFSPTAIKIRGLAPDAIFVSAFPPNVLALLKELDTQGFQAPVLVNALIWPGNFPQVVTAGAQNIHTIGFNTNESAPGIKGHDEFVARYAKLSDETKILAKPANSANASLAYDAAMMLMGIMQEKKIDGTTDVQTARDEIATALNALKSWHGLNDITMKDSGDGYIRSHLLEMDVAGKTWKYSLPSSAR